MKYLKTFFFFFFVFAFSHQAFSNNSYKVREVEEKMHWMTLYGLADPIYPESVGPGGVVAVLMGEKSLVVTITYKTRINIKVTDESGSPIYLRQYNPTNPGDITIDISNWLSGNYTVSFDSMDGSYSSFGRVTIP